MKNKLQRVCRYSVFLIAAITSTATQALSLHSQDIAPGKSLTAEQVFNGFGCTGKNISPALSWKDAPKNTKSFAITAYDPDAPTGSGWWHWLAFDIPNTVTALDSDAGNGQKNLMPSKAIQSRTDYGSYGYGGACPPAGHGKHRYQFKGFALDVKTLGLDKNTSSAMIGFMLNQHKLASAVIEAHYQR